ncbi:MAG: metalloprotease PmbA [Candidatus Accumulibacter sp.]|jgi:PmbA protein|nr:metalloprotease PmbA [Accumulibacter sp.]
MSESRFAHTFENLLELARDTLDLAGKAGAAACEVDVSEGFGQSVMVRRGEVDTIEHNRDSGIGVTIYLGAPGNQRKGHASTSNFSPAALRETVDAATNIARFTAPDACAGLPDEDLLAGRDEAFADLDLYHPWSLDVEGAIDLARRCEGAAFAVSPLIANSDGAAVSIQEGQFVSANSAGFIGGYPTSRHTLSCVPIAADRGRMQRDDWFSVSRNSEALAPAESIGDYAARRALSRLAARRIKTCQAPVLFEAPLAASLIAHFVHAASGGSLYRKTSFLVDALGSRVFSKGFQISERPRVPGALASAPFDGDGVATRAREVVEDGVLQGYFLSAYTARKLGMPTTGNAGGCHNLLVKPGKHDFRGLLKEMRRGLLVTELLGQGVNYVTGDYSRGAVGYWVENGEIAYPVEEITIAGNLRDMFKNIVAVGNDILVQGARQTGSILVAQMKIAGN